jgi:hypothetical protein
VLKIKKIAREGKIQILVETREPLQSYVSPFVQKKCVKNVVKNLIMLKVQSPAKGQRSCLFFIAKNSLIKLFYCQSGF